MKIIKEGKIPYEVVYIYQGRCGHCSCEVEVTKEEAAGSVKCPTKGCVHYINVKGRVVLPPMPDDGWAL